jgi:hypothetical protein
MLPIKEVLEDLEEENKLRNLNTLRFKNEEKNKWIHNGFVMVGNDVLSDKAVSAPAKILYLLLMRRLFQKDYCFPGRDTLADELGLSPRQVDRYLQELKPAKWINITRRGQGKTNVYHLIKE